MKIHRQLGICWIAGSFWLLAAAYVYVLPRLGTFYYPPDSEKALVWSYFIAGKRYAVIQVNKGDHLVESWRFTGVMPISMKEVLMIRKLYQQPRSPSFIPYGSPKLVWFPRDEGATKTVAAIILADRGYPLLMPVEGFLLAIGLILIVGPALLMRARYRKYEKSLPKMIAGEGF